MSNSMSNICKKKKGKMKNDFFFKAPPIKEIVHTNDSILMNTQTAVPLAVEKSGNRVKTGSF